MREEIERGRSGVGYEGEEEEEEEDHSSSHRMRRAAVLLERTRVEEASLARAA
jgi:hypothetical protein